jgi:hypothetical protein
MKKIVGVFIFLSGVGIGVLGSYYFIKKHLEKVMDDDFQARRNVRIENNDQMIKEKYSSTLEKINANLNKPDLSSYSTSLSNYGYGETRVDYSKTDDNDPESKEIHNNIFDQKGIGFISQNEFVDNDHDESWEAIGLTFFRDGVLGDENNDEIKDPEKFVGPVEDIDHFFLMNDSDVLYIRNNNLKIDYEICYDNRCYSDVKKTMPTPVRGEDEE